MARQRVDNYAAGFLAAGAKFVIADTSRPMAAWYIRGIFTSGAGVDAIWRAAPNRHGHVSTVASRRMSSAYLRTDPVRVHSGFSRSIVGRGTFRAASPAPPPPSARPPGRASGPIVVTRNNVTIDGVTITSSGQSGDGIRASGVQNLTIRNCTIRGFNKGIEVDHVRNLVIENCVIEDAYYAGIAVYSGIGGRISGNIIRRIGYTRTNMWESGIENNAYGITLDRYHSGNLVADPMSANFLIASNLVEDVPLWMGINLHAGSGIDIVGNTVRRCPRAIFIAGDGDSPLHHPARVNVLRNRLEQAVTKAGGTTSEIGVMIAGLQGGSIVGNLISGSFAATIYDYAGEGNGPSVGVTISGNTTIR